jgi:hypothetical protein
MGNTAAVPDVALIAAIKAQLAQDEARERRRRRRRRRRGHDDDDDDGANDHHHDEDDEDDEDDDDEDEDEDDDEDDEAKATRRAHETKDRDLILYESIEQEVAKWAAWQEMQQDVIHCDLMDIDEAIQQAFDSRRTPLVFDTSKDDKLSTYLSYQPDVVLLEARTLIIDSSKQPLIDVMDYARARLVGAMKHGKTLVIRMGTSAPDFKSTFNDDVLIQRGVIPAYSKDDPALRVLEKNRRRNELQKERDAMREKLLADGGDNDDDNDNDNGNDDDDNGNDGDRDGREEELDYREVQRRYYAELEASDEPFDVGQAYFPREVFVEGGQALKGGGWPERLFKEEDMKPHKNFAYCRDEFRVLLVSQLPLRDADEYLFGEHWGGLPLPKGLFKLVSVTYDEEDMVVEAEDPWKRVTEAKKAQKMAQKAEQRAKKEAEARDADGKDDGGDDDQGRRPRQRGQLTSASAPTILTATEAKWMGKKR